MKFYSVFFSSLITLSLSQIAMGAGVENTKQDKLERWFEIEVILFKQLANKAELKEHFPTGIDASKLPEYQKSYDLLTPYLQPDLTRVKQFIPVCGEQDEDLLLGSLLSSNIEILNAIPSSEFDSLLPVPNFTEEKSQENITKPALLPFIFDLQIATLAKPIFSTDKICIITEKNIESLFVDEQLANLNLDSFPIDTVPNKLMASGIHNSNSPYLIADESLLLKDISQRLSWSQEFKPLLHFGWRQVGITKNKAIPLKLFAGEHAEQKYQQALIQYKTEIQELETIEGNLFEQLNQAQNSLQKKNQILNSEDMKTDFSLLNTTLADKSPDNQKVELVDYELKIISEKKQQILNQLFSRIKHLTDNPISKNMVNDVVSDLSQQNLESILVNNKLSLDDKALNISSAPKKPLQPWFLDGFLKVHLDHYLYITADFNIFNQNPIARFTEESKTNHMNLINFSQNRRVISGEIHYFDHPHIGMIVQIRRFDPTKPADEAISQAVK